MNVEAWITILVIVLTTGVSFSLATIIMLALIRLTYLYSRMRMAGVPVDWMEWLFAQLRLRPMRVFARAMIELHKAGVPVKLRELDRHYRAGGRVERVAEAVLQARREGVVMSFAETAAADLAALDPARATAAAAGPTVEER